MTYPKWDISFSVSILSRLKREIAITACHPSIGSVLSVVFSNRIPANGMLVDTACPQISPSIKAMLFWGLYERAERRFVRRYLRDDLDVIELGSSLGIVSCQIRKILRSGKRLICVEANPSLIPTINTNLVLNKLESNVLVLNKAIDYQADDKGTISLVPGSDTLAGQVAKEESGNINVKATKLSDLISENGIKSLTLVSDIEGSEAGIIFKDAGALQKCEQIIIELHDTIFEGRLVTVTELKDRLIRFHGFTLQVEHGPVCVFNR